MANIDDREVKFTYDDSVKSGRGLSPIRQHHFTLDFDHADLGVAALSATGIDFDPDNEIPADAIIVDWSRKVRTAFVGPSISAITMDVGDVVNPDELIDGADLETIGYARTDRGTYSKLTDEPNAYAPLGSVVAVGANLNVLTAGRVEFTIYYFAPLDPDA